jgi:uncharacterized protein (TIGR02757 family)
MNHQELREFLDEKTDRYNRNDFIQNDPISIPHRFTNPRDIELIGFLVATISWGRRDGIIKNGNRLVELMDNAPHQFITNFKKNDLKRFNGFVHRTFNADDLHFFLSQLQKIIQQFGTLEQAFFAENTYLGLIRFRTLMLGENFPKRVQKHLSDVAGGSAAKRLNMYLRWMVRKDQRGVDFGIWNNFQPAQLYLPLDVHTANVSRKLHLLKRTQNDWKAVEEVTTELRKLDPVDPVKYDFALFSLGAIEQF